MTNKEAKPPKYVMRTPRKRQPAAVRRDIFKRENGECYNCGLSVVNTEGWEFLTIGQIEELLTGVGADLDHLQRLEDGGLEDPSNVHILCAKCHKKKTTAENKQAAKDRAVFDKTTGLNRFKKPKSRPIPGSKASGLKKTLDGRVISRRTGKNLTR